MKTNSRAVDAEGEIKTTSPTVASKSHPEPAAGGLATKEKAVDSSNAPPLPAEDPPLPSEEPPLPAEEPPQDDDGWEAILDPSSQAYYFYNRFTNATQWENPRVPEATAVKAPEVDTNKPGSSPPQGKKGAAGGYNPAIHGDYDPNADYAQEDNPSDEEALAAQMQLSESGSAYTASAGFNRFTGRFQANNLNPENFNDENKSKRQMKAFFDVDAAANSHDGRSLKAERANKKLTKKEVQAYNEKRRAKKEEKRRAWLKD